MNYVEEIYMYKAIDVARYIINYLDDNGMSITNLKLQKILYYVQAAFLTSDEKEACYSDAIICWQHGPVVKSVYDYFKKFGAGKIERQDSYRRIAVKDGSFVFENVKFDSDIIKECDKQRINDVVDALEKYDAWTLVDKTHEEDPWLKLTMYNIEITKERIRKYFETGNNRRRIYGQFN